MYAFVVPARPHSVQSRHPAHYKEAVRRAFLKYVPEPERLNAPLYGVVYYFHNVKTDTDADNVIKPVWDSLEGTAFDDDRIIRWRLAGVFDLSQAGVDVLDVTRVPEPVLTDLYDMIDNRDHFVYVEFGRLNVSMYRLGLEDGDSGN
jgi:Holliday junction resolvase RusA-like endonuclease